MNMNENTRFLIAHNKKQSDHYGSPDQVQLREKYLREHTSDVLVTKCMDGRVNVPIITGIPMGVFSPFRSMGAKFDIGSPGFAPHVLNFYNHVHDRWQKEGEASGIVLNTYHFSRSKKELGCKGFGFDTQKACQCTQRLRDKFEGVYGKSHMLIHPICVGVETDEDALVIHGDNGKTLDVSQSLAFTQEDFRRELGKLFPNMRERVLKDLLPMVVGNRAHVESIRRENKPVLELDHREKTIAIGRGFDWLHLVNEALIVGTFNIDWLHEVEVAATIVLNNLKREPELARKGATVIASAPHRGPGVEAAMSREKALSNAREAWEHIQKTESTKELFQKFDVDLLVGTLDRNTMQMHWLDHEGVEAELKKAA